MTIKSATPVELRKALEMASDMAKARIRFVCVPVLSDDDYDQMLAVSMSRIDLLINKCDEQEARP